MVNSLESDRDPSCSAVLSLAWGKRELQSLEPACLQATFEAGIPGLRIRVDKRSDTTFGLVTWNIIISKLAFNFFPNISAK
jgi:hypothetical protein